jgi:hypothetical protein
MLDQKNLFELARVTARANAASPVAYSFGDNKFSYTELNDTLRAELNAYSATPQLYRENKHMIFSLIEVAVDDVLPQKVMDMYSMFAEIKQFNQGEKAVFTQRVTAASRRRAKQFITKVGNAGVYETFKLDGRSYELQATAIGGAAAISFEEFLDGRMNLAEMLDIVMEGLDEVIYKEIANALAAGIQNLQEANVAVRDSFEEAAMDHLIAVASVYGVPTIYCTYEFATTMVPSEGWVADAHRVERWNNGYLANYKGTRVIVLPQSFEDETNKVKVIDPSYAYVIPTGADKPIKIAFEGGTLADDRDTQDWGKEIHVYKKVGIGAVITNNICVYRNTSLKK